MQMPTTLTQVNRFASKTVFAGMLLSPSRADAAGWQVDRRPNPVESSETVSVWTQSAQGKAYPGLACYVHGKTHRLGWYLRFPRQIDGSYLRWPLDTERKPVRQPFDIDADFVTAWYLVLDLKTQVRRIVAAGELYAEYKPIEGNRRRSRSRCMGSPM
jgi:hypothetical protein